MILNLASSSGIRAAIAPLAWGVAHRRHSFSDALDLLMRAYLPLAPDGVFQAPPRLGRRWLLKVEDRLATRLEAATAAQRALMAATPLRGKLLSGDKIWRAAWRRS